MKRRTLLSAGLAAGMGGLLWRYWPEDGFANACLANGIPLALAEHPLVLKAIQGLDFTRVWDNHVHLVGTGTHGGGVWVNPEMETWRHPLKYIQYRFYLDGSCVKPDDDVDAVYMSRLLKLVNELPAGMKLMLLAFDYFHDDKGRASKEKSTLFTSNEYTRNLAMRFPERFEWVASIHPYRPDAIDELRKSAGQGARAVKWLPEAMNINPSSRQCSPFYRAMQELNLPLLCHAGHETAVGTTGGKELGNPLLLRTALDHGVRVIVAHCASLGSSTDLDKGKNAGEKSCFELFARMMAESRYEGLLLGDISAVLQLNRLSEPVKQLLLHDEWHGRLLNGSDYPLPGIFPLFPLRYMVRAGLLREDQSELLMQIRRYNPVWFDFLLKRMVRWSGKGFANAVFETRSRFAGSTT